MRLYLLFIVIFACLSAHGPGASAQTLEDDLGLGDGRVDTRAVAMRYYEDCMVAHNTQPPPIAETLCSCTAGGVYESLSAAQLRNYGAKTDAGAALSKLIHNEIYTLCTGHAVRDLKYDACMTHDSLRDSPKRLDICSCAADAMGDYARISAGYIIGKDRTKYSRKLDKNAPDMLAALLSDHGYLARDKQMTKICVQKHLMWLE